MMRNDSSISPFLCKDCHKKGKVESANRFVDWLKPYENELSSEDDLIRKIYEFNVDVNNAVNQTTGIPPIKLIKKEMEHLRPIPNKVLLTNYVQNVTTQEVPSTLLVNYKQTGYSVPKEFIGKRVKLIPAGDKLYIYYNNELIALHNITEKKFSYRPQDYIDGFREAMPADLSDEEITSRAEANLALFDQLEEMKHE